MAKKNNPTGFKYKVLPSDKVTLKPIPNPDIEINIAEEKNDLAPEQGKLTYGQRRSEELRDAHSAYLYGSPAEMTTKITPLHKKGKSCINYAAKLTQDAKEQLLASDANSAFKAAIAKQKTTD
jgi:hypothetical protein